MSESAGDVQSTVWVPMTRRLVAILAIAVGSLVMSPVTPASSGDYYWSDTACWHHAPVYGAWYGTPGVGAAYASVFAWDDWPSHTNSIVWHGQNLRYQAVNGYMHGYYASLGYECGWAGFPASTYYRAPTYWLKHFYYPGTCDLRWLVEFDNGSTGPGIAPNYFC